MCADTYMALIRSVDVLIQSFGLVTSFTITHHSPLEPLLVDIAGADDLIKPSRDGKFPVQVKHNSTHFSIYNILI